jgi:protein-disulfide isomerase
MTRLGELATRDGVTGTPTFFLNGELMSPESIGNSTGGHDYAKFAALLDAAIAAHAAGG